MTTNNEVDTTPYAGHQCEYPPDCELTPEKCAMREPEIEVVDATEALPSEPESNKWPGPYLPEKSVPSEQQETTPTSVQMEAGITGRPRYYRHPQGSTITVWPDDTLDARKPDGKKKKTSATAEKLRAGHGAWTEVDSLDEPFDDASSIMAQQAAAEAQFGEQS